MKTKEMKFVFGNIEMSWTPETVERVMRQWEAEHPGMSARDMGSEEFATRMMNELRASAKHGPEVH